MRTSLPLLKKIPNLLTDPFQKRIFGAQVSSFLTISRLFVKGVNIDMHATNAKNKQSSASILQLFSIRYLLLQPLESIFMGMMTITEKG